MKIQFLIAAALPAALACSENDSTSSSMEPEDNPDVPTYYTDTKPIIDERCATCHQPGEIGPFPLTNYDEVSTFAGPVRASIENGTMPPWMPSDECNSYIEDIDLTDEETAVLMAWFDAGFPAGNPSDAVPSSPPNLGAGFQADYSLQLPEAYTPVREPDDYRCQLIPWPAEGVEYVTGIRVNPDQRAIVHHAILFLAGPDQVEQYQAYDDAEEGPGYTCYGGPTGGDGLNFDDVELADLLPLLQEAGLSIADLQAGRLTQEQLETLLGGLGLEGGAGAFASLGSWVPGIPNAPFPAGTGIKVEPGSMIVAQFHYNTSSAAPVPDQSTIEISTTGSVEREASSLAVLDLGWVTNGVIGDPMTIPAGEAEVKHSTTVSFDGAAMMRARQILGLADDAPLVIHNANHHMHELGVHQRSELRHSDGEVSCLLDIPEWDFAWQGAYTLQESITFRPGDELWMGCTWNNTAANQPIIDGVPRDPVDVSWGEGTSDEMCLGAFYVTAE